jgi:hypothetical protein
MVEIGARSKPTKASASRARVGSSSVQTGPCEGSTRGSSASGDTIAPSVARTRARISRVAFSVKVTTRIRSSDAPRTSNSTTRCSSV